MPILYLYTLVYTTQCTLYISTPPGYDKERAPLVGGAPAHQTIIIPIHTIVWGRYPVQTNCVNCSHAVLTSTDFITGQSNVV